MGLVRPPLIGFDTKLLFRYNVFLLLGWAFISMLGYITLLYSMSDFSASIELSKTHAAAISAYLNLGTAVRRSLTGFISDRYGRIQVAGLCTFICGILCFTIWFPAKTYG
jgi:MFS family permease